ncbi:hypothetical protein V5R04_15655 [Jonesiaceae bacterium BS-20]|uniref:Uncharacterized protein n=1 Tax=Jonesiaceae bacterium BS-20 TaxID=3120821 RepID=A0AAU7DWI0_9MICO
MPKTKEAPMAASEEFPVILDDDLPEGFDPDTLDCNCDQEDDHEH